MATVVYNDYNIPNVFGKIKYTEDYISVLYVINFLLIANSASALITLYNTAVAKLTERNKSFKLNFGTTPSEEVSYSHTENTGFLSEGTVLKINSELSTETTRHCVFSCLIKLPFDQSTYNFRQNASFEFFYLPTKQKLCNFKVTYTAGGSNSAYDNYLLYAKTWATGILARFASTFEIIKENISEEQEEKILNASITYKEIISNQAGIALRDDPKLVDIKILYKLNLPQETGYPVSSNIGNNVNPSGSVILFFNCPINKELLNDNQISSYYHGTIRPYLISKQYEYLNLTHYNTLDGNKPYVVSEDYSLDNHSAILSGKVVFSVPSNGRVAVFNEVYTTHEDKRLVYLKLWDGKDDTYSIWTTGRSLIIERVITIGKLEQRTIEPTQLQGSYLLLKRSVSDVIKKFNHYTGTAPINPYLYITTIKEVYLYNIQTKLEPSYTVVETSYGGMS